MSGKIDEALKTLEEKRDQAEQGIKKKGGNFVAALEKKVYNKHNMPSADEKK